MQEMWVPFLGQEDLLEEDMATHSSTLACEIPWTEEPGGTQSVGLQRVPDMTDCTVTPTIVNNDDITRFFNWQKSGMDTSKEKT